MIEELQSGDAPCLAGRIGKIESFGLVHRLRDAEAARPRKIPHQLPGFQVVEDNNIVIPSMLASRGLRQRDVLNVD
jgi:hypothetical protein